jgi:hypothetical protein
MKEYQKYPEKLIKQNLKNNEKLKIPGIFKKQPGKDY